MTPDLQAIMQRVDRVEHASFISLYEDAPADLNAGLYESDGVFAAWLGSHDDPGFSFISNIDAAENPEEALAEIVAMLARRGAKVIGIDDHPDMDPSFDTPWFARQGFEPDYDEQLWWRPLADIERQPEPDGVIIREAGPGDRNLFAATLNVGFGKPENAGLGRAYAAVIGKAGWRHYLVDVDGEPGAASAMFIAEQVADCFVASTRPAARRRGAQTALIQRRMADGREAGCDIATAQSVTDNASPRNFERHGFRPVYRRTIYARRLQRS